MEVECRVWRRHSWAGSSRSLAAASTIEGNSGDIMQLLLGVRHHDGETPGHYILTSSVEEVIPTIQTRPPTRAGHRRVVVHCGLPAQSPSPWLPAWRPCEHAIPLRHSLADRLPRSKPPISTWTGRCRPPQWRRPPIRADVPDVDVVGSGPRLHNPR